MMTPFVVIGALLLIAAALLFSAMGVQGLLVMAAICAAVFVGGFIGLVARRFLGDR